MFTSVTDEGRRRLMRHAAGELIGALFCAVFGMIYEVFSHEVYSYFMIYAFAVPLVLGVLPCALLLNAKKYPGKTAAALWNSGTAALSVGCAFRGALDIYGTTNRLLLVYPAAAIVILAVAAATAIKNRKIKSLL